MKPRLTTIFPRIILTVVIQQFANAQIVYPDVNPDVTFPSTYNLDLNNDREIDFVTAHTSMHDSVRTSFFPYDNIIWLND